MGDSFKFRNEWHLLIQSLPQDLQLLTYQNICIYAMSGREPENPATSTHAWASIAQAIADDLADAEDERIKEMERNRKRKDSRKIYNAKYYQKRKESSEDLRTNSVHLKNILRTSYGVLKNNSASQLIDSKDDTMCSYDVLKNPLKEKECKNVNLPPHTPLSIYNNIQEKEKEAHTPQTLTACAHTREKGYLDEWLAEFTAECHEEQLAMIASHSKLGITSEDVRMMVAQIVERWKCEERTFLYKSDFNKAMLGWLNTEFEKIRNTYPCVWTGNVKTKKERLTEEIKGAAEGRDFPADQLNAFFLYWGETDTDGHLRLEREKTWSTAMRLKKWMLKRI